MAVLKEKDVRIFRDLINLTDDDISLYDESGNIIKFKPYITDYKTINFTPDIGAIVRSRSHAKLLNIPFDNVVIVYSTGTGRDGVIVSKLMHPADNRTVVLSHRHA